MQDSIFKPMYGKVHAVNAWGLACSISYAAEYVYSSVMWVRGTPEQLITITSSQISMNVYRKILSKSLPFKKKGYATLQASTPYLGPLHVSLNAREDLMINHHSLLKHIYESIFTWSKLANKPKPRRTSLTPN